MTSFRGKDFRKETVRGRDFTGCDLSGADFRRCDLTGAKFDNCLLLSTRFDGATLTGASFERSRMGRGWVRVAMVHLGAFLISSIFALVGVAVTAVMLDGAFTARDAETLWGLRIGLLLMLLVHTSVVLFGTRAVGAVGAVVAAVAGVAVGAVGAVVAGVAVGPVGAGALWFLILSIILFARARRNHCGFEWLHDNQIRAGALFGTAFRNADLTDASFAHATVDGANFGDAEPIRTRWTGCAPIERAWFDDRWRDPILRQVLVTGQAEKLDLSNRNLIGVNCAAARLAKANLAHADLTGATLAGADLRDANLAEAQALGTDFEGANLTGACLRDWNIDKSTRLRGVECRYFFLSETENENGHRDRRPHDPDRELAPGDFQKLFTQVQETIELLIRKGVDRASFRHALQSMMTIYPETRGAIRSVEQVDGDLIVRLHADPATDAIGVEQAFYSALDSKSLQSASGAGKPLSLPPASPADAALLPEAPRNGNRRARIFISYAHADERLLDGFRKHLATLERLDMAEIWHDRKIPAGDEWEAEIDHRLAQADIILLLISPSFIASDYCYKREVPAAFARRDRGEATVIPIAVESCDRDGLPFDRLQMPRQGKPITEARNRNAAWLEVVRALRPVIAGN